MKNKYITIDKKKFLKAMDEVYNKYEQTINIDMDGRVSELLDQAVEPKQETEVANHILRCYCTDGKHNVWRAEKILDEIYEPKEEPKSPKLPSKLNVFTEDGFLKLKVEKRSDINEDIFQVEAAIIVVAEKLNELLDYLESREK